jgi:hypothetical protein
VSKSIFVDPLSPSLDERDIPSPFFARPQYKGRSSAIHVKGPRSGDLPPGGWIDEGGSCDPGCIEAICVDAYGVDRCAIVQFDDFSGRETAGKSPDWWGLTSGNGYPWYAHNSSGFQWTGAVERAWVTGGYGYLGIHYLTSWEYSYVTITQGPWVGTTDWSIVVRFKFSVDLPPASGVGNDWYTQQFYIQGFGPVSPLGKFGEALGWMQSGGQGLLYDTWYRARFEYHPSEMMQRHRTWLDSDAEPATWDEETSFAIDPALNSLRFYLSARRGISAPAVGTEAQVQIDFIEFYDYDGKPCYYDCENLDIVETFTRSASNGWGTSEIASLPWNVSASSLSVNGGEGVALGGYGGSSNNIILSNAASTLAVLPLEILFKVRMTRGVDNTPGGSSELAGAYVWLNKDSATDRIPGVGAGFAAYPGTGGNPDQVIGYIYADGSGAVSSAIIYNGSDWESQSFWCRFIAKEPWYGGTGGATRYYGGQARWWKDGDPEPATWNNVQYVDSFGFYPKYLVALPLGPTSPADVPATIYYDSIRIVSGPCTPVYSGTGPDCVDGCTDAICGITDSFSRVVPSPEEPTYVPAIGASDSGLTWHATQTYWGVSSDWAIEVDGSALHLRQGTEAGDPWYMRKFGGVELYADSELDTPYGSMSFRLTNGAAYAILMIRMRYSAIQLCVGPRPLDDYPRIILGREGGLPPVEANIGFTTDWWHVRWEDTEALSRAKVWPASAPEPAGWDVSSDLAVDPADEKDGRFWLNELSTNAYHWDPVDGYVHDGEQADWLIDNLDIEGVTRCDVVTFDDFNRVVNVPSGQAGDHVGTATPSGYHWTDDGYSGGVSYVTVNGQALELESEDGSASGIDFSMWTDYLSNAPWSGEFTMTMRIKSSAFDTESTSKTQKLYISLQGTAWSREWGINMVNIASDGGHWFEGSDFIPKYDWVPNAWYLLKWHHVPDTIDRVKLWLDGQTEPGWAIEEPSSGTQPSAVRFEVEWDWRTSPDFTMCWVSQIELDDGDTACYPGGPSGALPIEAGYLPIFRRQIGDPTTTLDSYICGLTSAAMALDWHTRGAVQVWGGELIPWCGRTEAEIIAAPGTNLGNAAQAWTHWGQYLSIRSGQTFDNLLAALREGRAIVLAGDYDQFSLAERCQDSFLGNHGILVLPYYSDGRWVVGDPLCSNFKTIAETSLKDYAEDFGIQVYGATYPQKIAFAATRAWVLSIEPPPSGQGSSVTVSSISELLSALANTGISQITLANGVYSTSPLIIDGAAHPNYIRTAATSVLVRAETTGGVTLDFGGSGIAQWFRGGAAYQEWRGFKYANVLPGDNGVIEFGEGNGVPVHHITLRNIEFLSSIVRQTSINSQGIYFSWANLASGGNHDILVDGFVSNADLWSAVHVYHDDLGHVGHHITVKNATVGTNHTMGIVLWSHTIHDYLFEDINVVGANEYGVRHAIGGTGLTLRRVTTTGSGVSGFYSGVGTYPNVPGMAFDNCSFS